MRAATLLLPSGQRFARGHLTGEGARALGRSDRLTMGEPGRRAQLLRYFGFLPRGGWPIAALWRQLDASDAKHATWLFAEPAWLRPEINGVRLMAYGQRMQMTRGDCDALLPALKPLFGDAGFLIDAPRFERWYVRLPAQARFPAFADPADALGDDVFEYLDTTPEGRRWRALDSEVQVVLHNHPWNAQRQAQGKPPINALWFWGGGELPSVHDGQMANPQALAYSDDRTLHALAAGAGAVEPLPRSLALPAHGEGPWLFDLTHLQDLAQLQRDWLMPALVALGQRRIQALVLDSEDGLLRRIERHQRWRLWRKPLTHLSA